MKLLAVGDSFTYGEELSDLNNAWPYLLGNKLGHTADNLAKPGSGNTRMVRHAVEQINNYDLIIIAWSHFARTELADENGFYDLWPGCSALPHKEFSPWRSDAINYYSKHHNDQYLYNQYLINIVLTQQYLKFNNKKYIMLNAFGNNNYRKNNTVVDQIDSTYYIGWPNETMMEWTYGTPQGPGGHFLEQGHQRVADKIYEHIRYLGWVS
jgi:lysophospholipase L1-like esterase